MASIRYSEKVKMEGVYGLTLVDNRKCNVFNGSDLGKAYSGQALMKSFKVTQGLVKAGEKERQSIP